MGRLRGTGALRLPSPSRTELVHSPLSLTPSQPDPLTEGDLVTLSEFGRQLFSRQETASHSSALSVCVKTALLWARGEDSEMLVVGEKKVLLGRLRNRLRRVVNSEFSAQLPVAVHTDEGEVKRRLGQVGAVLASRTP